MTTASAETAQQSYRPTPEWKLKGRRKPLPLWDRTKFLLLLALLFGVLVWNKYLEIAAGRRLGRRRRAGGRAPALDPVLAIVEVVRQLHFRLSELSARYHRFWTERVFGRSTSVDRAPVQRLDPVPASRA